MVRRTAEIFLFDPDDYECLFAKYGINGFWKEEDFRRHEQIMAFLDERGIKYPEWFHKIGERHYDASINVDPITKEPRKEKDGSLSPYNFGTGFYHRAMSNNSVVFTSKPDRDLLHTIIELMKSEGEPGFFNLEAARRRRPDAEGTNPCGEINLADYGVCNLTTVNVTAFVKPDRKGGYVLDLDGLIDAQRLSARAGLRMTLVTLEIPHWDAVQKRDRLIGPSVTGWKDAMDMLGCSKEKEEELMRVLHKVAREAADEYAKELQVNKPLLTTCVKPEGTLSQVFGGVSAGLHLSHSPYYIRRIRINADDPLAKAVLHHKGWVVNPENGTPGETYEEKMKNARTLVISFPVASGAKRTKDDTNVHEQFDTYFSFQRNYTEHNSSNTITVRPHEWADVEERVWNGWDDFIGVSFLAYDGGTYQQPPYEACTKEQYEQLKSQMQDFDMNILLAYETPGDDESSLDGMDGCEGGVCPIR